MPRAWVRKSGFYQDPGSDYGRLRSELFRAVRLVVDTGIHDQGWTRERCGRIHAPVACDRRAYDPVGDGSLHLRTGARR